MDDAMRCLKAGMMYGKGDHMLDHISHTLRLLPVFATVGFSERTVRPVAVEDSDEEPRRYSCTSADAL